jgi:hypothetical protein
VIGIKTLASTLVSMISGPQHGGKRGDMHGGGRRISNHIF